MVETKPVWVVWQNTDLTEGRGYLVPIHVCESETTAYRLAKGKGVQGSDAEVSFGEAVKHMGHWCAPVQVIKPTAKDIDADARKAAAREADRRKHEALERARLAGLSEEDIQALMGAP